MKEFCALSPRDRDDRCRSIRPACYLRTARGLFVVAVSLIFGQALPNTAEPNLARPVRMISSRPHPAAALTRSHASWRRD